MNQPADPTVKMMQAGVLAWLLPGAGHYFLGHRGLAAVFFGAITFAYAVGLGIGGVKTSVNPFFNHWLFLAELGTGGYTAASYYIGNATGGIDARLTDAILHKKQIQGLSDGQRRELEEKLVPYVSFYPESDVAQIYLAIAGLMNLLAVLDALARAQTGGLPVFAQEMAPEPSEPSEPSEASA